jgi:hypothetical protein
VPKKIKNLKEKWGYWGRLGFGIFWGKMGENGEIGG